MAQELGPHAIRALVAPVSSTFRTITRSDSVDRKEEVGRSMIDAGRG
jgi:hypothetical protein